MHQSFSRTILADHVMLQHADSQHGPRPEAEQVACATRLTGRSRASGREFLQQLTEDLPGRVLQLLKVETLGDLIVLVVQH